MLKKSGTLEKGQEGMEKDTQKGFIWMFVNTFSSTQYI